VYEGCIRDVYKGVYEGCIRGALGCNRGVLWVDQGCIKGALGVYDVASVFCESPPAR